MNYKNILDNQDKPTIGYDIGVDFITSEGINIFCLKRGKDYDAILLKYLSVNFARNETTFLKNGIKEIYTALHKIEFIKIKSINEIKSELQEKYKDKTHLITFDNTELTPEKFTLWLNAYTKTQFENLEYKYNCAKEVLNYELINYRNKLSRLGIEIIVKNDNVNFIELNKNKPLQTKPQNPDAVEKSLFDFLYNIENKKDFIQDLKETFPTEKGKDIKAIINILKDENIIIHGTREFKKLCNSINTAFERNIGEYSGINDPKYIDELTNTTILKKLNPLIIRYKTK